MPSKIVKVRDIDSVTTDNNLEAGKREDISFDPVDCAFVGEMANRHAATRLIQGRHLGVIPGLSGVFANSPKFVSQAGNFVRL